MAKYRSPCIDVCKFKRRGPAGDHCIGCSMTKAQKRVAKKAVALGKAEANAIVALIMTQQAQMGRYDHWRAAYLKRCAKKNAPVPKMVRRAD